MEPDPTHQKLVHVMTFGGSHVAHAAVGVLAKHGITARVQGDALSDALSYYGPAVSKVQLVTLADDAERALKILQKLELEARQDDGPWGDGEVLWLCADCDEQNARTFDQCWSCAADRPAQPRWIPVAADEQKTPSAATAEPPTTAVADDQSPYRVPASGTAVPRPPDRDSLEERAIRAANISAVLLPLGFYGLYLCYRCYTSGITSRKVLASAILSLVTSGFTVLLILFLG